MFLCGVQEILYTLWDLGIVYQRLGDHQESRHSWQQALSFAEQGKPLGHLRALIGLANLHFLPDIIVTLSSCTLRWWKKCCVFWK